jgi:hypothetical protein
MLKTYQEQGKREKVNQYLEISGSFFLAGIVILKTGRATSNHFIQFPK